jgi:hypothetical protein
MMASSVFTEYKCVDFKFTDLKTGERFDEGGKAIVVLQEGKWFLNSGFKSKQEFPTEEESVFIN